MKSRNFIRGKETSGGKKFKGKGTAGNGILEQKGIATKHIGRPKKDKFREGKNRCDREEVGERGLAASKKGGSLDRKRESSKKV